MKKLFLLLAFFGTFALTTATAQTASTETATEMTAADTAAAADEAITSETCAHSGTVSYYRSAADKGGAISKTKVSFDTATGTFVSANKKAACSTKDKASCAKGSKKAAKGCCSGKKKSSCSKKTK